MRESRLVGLLIATTALAFSRLWFVGWSWDDEALVVDNQLTASWSQLPELFRRDLWSTTRLSSLQSGYYRPLTLVSFTIDRALFPGSSAAAHVHSLVWHILAVLALFGLVRRILDLPRAVLVATVMALHPVQSEVLALVAARNDSMAAALLLAALWAVLDRQVPSPRLALAALLTAAGLLCKESVLLAPLLLLALDLGRWRRPGSSLRFLSLALGVGVALGLRAAASVGLPQTGSHTTEILARMPAIAAAYAQVLVWPWPLTPARTIQYLPSLAATFPFLMLVVGCALWALWAGRDRGLVAAGIAWAALTLVPTLAATVDKGLLGERYLYFPLAGVMIAVASGLPRVGTALSVAVALPCVLVLQLRLPQWQDSRTVWRAAHEAAPTPFTAAGYGWYLHRDGDLDQAIPLLVDALRGEPPYKDVCDLVVLAQIEAKDSAAAAATARWAVDERGCDPGGPISDHRALALADQGAWEEAAQVARSRPGGPTQTGLLVLAAAEAQAGNLAVVPKLALSWQGDRAQFSASVAKLLRLSGERAAGAQVLATSAASGGTSSSAHTATPSP